MTDSPRTTSLRPNEWQALCHGAAAQLAGLFAQSPNLDEAAYGAVAEHVERLSMFVESWRLTCAAHAGVVERHEGLQPGHLHPQGAATKRDEMISAEQNVKWSRINAEPFEYAVQQGPHGDEFVKLIDGTCLRRPIFPPPYKPQNKPSDLDAPTNTAPEANGATEPKRKGGWPKGKSRKPQGEPAGDVVQ